MHPLLLHRRALAAYLLAWALMGLGGAVWLAGQDGVEASSALALCLPVGGLLGFAALSLYYPCRSRPLRPGRWPEALAYRLVAALALASLTTLLAWAWNSLGSLLGHDRGWWAASAGGWGLVLLAFAGLFTVSALAHDLLIMAQDAQDAARREAEARVLAREMELQVLRMQIDPHFLFNSLNSISALTHLDPAAAREMTVHLAQFFRQTLALGQREHIPLAEELELVGHYLAIERQRLGPRLNESFEIAPEAQHAQLPPLTLQPLIENALKHGIRLVDTPGTLAVRALVREDWLHLSVSNPRPAEAQDASGLGHGLRHLQERLSRLYRGRAHLQARREPGQFVVEITLPLRP